MTTLTTSPAETKTDVLRSAVVRNVFSLYAGQAALYLAPLVVVPYLTRTLGISQWGTYSFALALSTQLSLLVEYGFGITGNRAVAANRGNASSIGRTLGAVICVKLLLAVVSFAIAAAEFSRVRSFHEQPSLFWWAVAAGIAQGFSFNWYFYGVEKIALSVGLDLAARLLVTLATVYLINTPSDAWIFFAAQAGTSMMIAAFGLRHATRLNSVQWPGLAMVLRTLREGFYTALSRPAFGVFAGLNVYVLGLYASADSIGHYSGAERIGRVVTAIPGPLCLAIFPRLTYLLAKDPAGLRRVRWMGGTMIAGAGLLASVGTFYLAPLLVRFLLGPGFEESIALLRILSLMPLLASLNQLLLYQYLFPNGMFNYMAACFAGITVIGLAAVILLGRGNNPVAIAWTANLVEASATLFLFWGLWRQRTQFA